MDFITMTVKYVEVFFSFRTFYHTMQKKTTLNFKNIYIFVLDWSEHSVLIAQSLAILVF